MFRSSYLPSAPASTPLTWVGAAVPPDKARIEALFGGALNGHFGLRSGGIERRSLICLDTADWRLRRAGLDLVYVERDGVLALSRPESGRIEQTTGRLHWPAVINGIPAGPIRDALSGPVWVRALLPIAKGRLVGLKFAVLNDDAKTVARLVWWDGALQAPGQAALPVRVDIECLRGYQKDAGEVERLLRAGAPLAVDKRLVAGRHARHGGACADRHPTVRDAAGSAGGPRRRGGLAWLFVGSGGECRWRYRRHRHRIPA